LLTITDRVTPEQAADAVIAVFVEGPLKRQRITWPRYR